MSDSPTPEWPESTEAQATPPLHLMGDPPLDELPVVPGYALVREIARGGMGVVYLARDPAFGRDVAVKVMHPGQESARFVVESKITAQLPHPGVPPVYALGESPDGRPFLAMKLIGGRTLAAEIRSARRADVPRLVAAFESVCQTVGFAHANGFIHRDLKPSNVMVGDFGEVLVLDWGLARTARDEGVGRDETKSAGPSPRLPPHSSLQETLAGTVKGTPAYMAPEQARGEAVGARADVFALGGILATILTGNPPFVGDTALDVVLMAAQAELGECFGELDACGADAELVAVARRALAPRPDDRFPDGAAVAAAVADYRAGVEERLRAAERDRAAAEARAAEQRRRRRVQLVLAVAVALLAAGAGAFAWNHDRQTRDARGRQARNRDALAAAVERTEVALRAGDSRAAGPTLDDAEKRAFEDESGEFRTRVEQLRADLTALEALDRVDQFRWRVSGTRLPDAAAVGGRWKEVFGGLGVVPGTTPAAEAATRITDSPVRDRLLAALDQWLVADPSQPLADVLRAADPDDHRDAVRAAVVAGNGVKLRALAASPAAPQQPLRFVLVWGKLDIPTERRRAVLEAAVLRRPGDLAGLMELGQTYPYGQPENVAERVRWYQAVVAAHPNVGVAWNNLAVALQDGGDLDGAAVAFRESLRCDPNDPLTHLNLGVAQKEMGDFGAAAAAYREVMRLDPRSAAAHNNLGVVRVETGDAAGAVAEFREAVRLDPSYTTAQLNLGDALFRAGDTPGAVAAIREAVKDPQYARDNPGLTGAVEARIVEHLKARRPDPARALALCDDAARLVGKDDTDRAIAVLQNAISYDPKCARAHTVLGAIWANKGQKDKAVAALRAAVRHDPKSAPAYHALGNSLLDKGDYNGAASAFREAIKHDEPRSSDSADLHIRLGFAHVLGGDLDAAAAALRDGMRLNPTSEKCRGALDKVLEMIAKRDAENPSTPRGAERP